MDDVQQKVLRDLFGSKATVLPIAFGAAALAASWAANSGVGIMVGVGSILAGVGITLTRWIMNLEQITQRAQQQLLRQEQEKHREDLRQLDASLVLDGDPRTESCLRQLREHYDAFQEKVRSGDVSAGYEVTSRVERLFQACIDQLRRSHDLWEEAHEHRGDAKQAILDEREEIVREVTATTEHIDRAVQHFRRLSARRDDNELSDLRSELDESLRVARLVDERMAAWERPQQLPESE